jgi:PPOX class probable F420-dependent enzyme
MQFEKAKPFLEAHHQSVVTTFRRSGAAQMSILLCGPYRDTVAFVAQEATAKVRNLRRNPRCSVLTVKPGWSGYVVVEGNATVHGWDDTDPESLRMMLREVFMAAGGQHDNWEEYDRTIKAERRAVVMVQPKHVYGLGV